MIMLDLLLGMAVLVCVGATANAIVIAIVFWFTRMK